MMPVRRWHQWCPNRYATLCMMYAISIADRWDRCISTHTKARKQLLKSNLRKQCLLPEKDSSFEVFALLQRDQLWESFLWQSGQLPTRKKKTLLFLLLVKELNLACMRNVLLTYYLRSCQLIRSSFFCMKYLLFLFFLMCPGLEVSLGVRKTEDIYLVALNTLYCVCGS